MLVSPVRKDEISLQTHVKYPLYVEGEALRFVCHVRVRNFGVTALERRHVKFVVPKC